jgi:hypothetical protein
MAEPGDPEDHILGPLSAELAECYTSGAYNFEGGS